ncbi:MAG: hypothetical protein EPN37_09435 [Chitinophagaceae bacterium]|nr:MAG: hypothetical protein EPN37_09435 [Chitinophagaceae bacterium]
MVTIEKKGDHFIFTIKGIHKLWALKSEITIPAAHIINAHPNKENLHIKLGLKMLGTGIPGVMDAGSFIGKDGIIFCDITNDDKSIVIELQHEHYKKMIIDVEDPQYAIELLIENKILPDERI